MTSKEALELLKGAGANLIEPYNSQVIEIFSKLVERDAPKKVKEGRTAFFTFPICPNCKEELNEYYKNKYCKDCGQRLDWSEYDEK